MLVLRRLGTSLLPLLVMRIGAVAAPAPACVSGVGGCLAPGGSSAFAANSQPVRSSECHCAVVSSSDWHGAAVRGREWQWAACAILKKQCRYSSHAGRGSIRSGASGILALTSFPRTSSLCSLSGAGSPLLSSIRARGGERDRPDGPGPLAQPSCSALLRSPLAEPSWPLGGWGARGGGYPCAGG